MVVVGVVVYVVGGSYGCGWSGCWLLLEWLWLLL